MKIVVWTRIAEAALLERLARIPGLAAHAVSSLKALPAAIADADILLMAVLTIRARRRTSFASMRSG